MSSASIRFAMFSALAVVGCTDRSIQGAAGPVQMNDVTILFPLATPAGSIDSAYLAASAVGARGTLLPQALYDAAGHVVGQAAIASPPAQYTDLHVVAVRLDPCFAALAPDPHGDGCLNQVRLVFQAVHSVGGELQAEDSALHVFYSVTRDELDSLVDAIVAARLASSPGDRLGPLAPHPLMVAQGIDGPMAQAVRELVLQHVGAANLTRVTELSEAASDFAWTFQGFDVTDANAPTITKMQIPTLAGATMQEFVRPGVAGGPAVIGDTSAFQPGTTSADNFEPLANVNSASQLTPDERQLAFTGLVHVDNPHDHSPNTIDCGSCHLSTPTSVGIAKPQFQLDEATTAGAFTADGLDVLASELTPTFDPMVAHLNVHAFSYAGRDPGISQRTVNETAAIVEYLNANEP